MQLLSLQVELPQTYTGQTAIDPADRVWTTAFAEKFTTQGWLDPARK